MREWEPGIQMYNLTVDQISQAQRWMAKLIETGDYGNAPEWFREWTADDNGIMYALHYWKSALEELVHLRQENAALKAQIHSLQNKVHVGSASPRETWPDHSEENKDIRESEDFSEAINALADKFSIPLTGNCDRWQDGVFVYHITEFMNDFVTIANNHLVD